MIANLLLKECVARKVRMFYFYIFLYVLSIHTHMANADKHIETNKREKKTSLNKFSKLAYAEHWIISIRIESSNQNPF